MYRFFILALVTLLLSSCAVLGPSANIPRIADEELEQFVRAEGRNILSVTENADKAHLYEFHLANLRDGETDGLRVDGQSVGNHQIYIDAESARQALTAGGHPHALRMTLAYGIARDVDNHAPNQRTLARMLLVGRVIMQGMSQVPGAFGFASRVISGVFSLLSYAAEDIYARSADLEAARKAIGYWKELGWDCRLWVYRFQSDLNRDAADSLHDSTEDHLEQAMELCPSLLDEERVAIKSRLADQRTEREEKRREREQDRE